MKLTERTLKKLIVDVIKENRRARLIEEYASMLNEVDIEELSDICYTAGSTHKMSTCRLGSDSYFLKFSDEELFEDFHPALQTLTEYLAYRIYGLFSGIKIPRPELVYDRKNKRIGLMTSPAKGIPMQGRMDNDLIKKIGGAMSAGVYVDIFLGNWDAAGTGNSFYDVENDASTRIDPGGALTFRAQGGRKGDKFSANPGELKTMLDPTMRGGAGKVYQYSDLSIAAREFLSVPWQRIDSEISTVGEQISAEIGGMGMMSLLSQWESDVNEIREKLKSRHIPIKANAQMMLKE